MNPITEFCSLIFITPDSPQDADAIIIALKAPRRTVPSAASYQSAARGAGLPAAVIK
jgi:hypothetical protein